MAVRLQKYLADAGVASRRASEVLITEGRVRVNDRTVRELGSKVETSDRVEVDGEPVRVKKKLYLALNKPRNIICARKDPEGRRTVLDLLPSEWSNLHPVGRLDYKTEGLLFLTNDGDFSLRVTHPRYGISKRYLVVVEGRVPPEVIGSIQKGIYEEGERLRAERAKVLKAVGPTTLVEVVMKEGKNREVRRLFEHHGLAVANLTRVQIGSIKLGELPSGRWRTLTASEIKSLLPEFGERTKSKPKAG